MSTKFAPRLRVRTIWKLKSLKTDSLGALLNGISHLDIKFSTTEKSKHTLITLGQCARPSLDNDCNTKMRPIKVRWFKQYWGHLMTIAWLEAICRRVPRMPRILPNPAAPVGTFLLQCQLIRFFRSSTRSRKSKPNTCPWWGAKAQKTPMALTLWPYKKP